MAIEIFGNIFQKIDNVVQSEIITSVSNVSDVLSPIMISAFTIYLLFVFLSYWQGSGLEGTLVDLLKRVMAWAVVIGFGANLSAYNNTVVPIVMNLGDGLVDLFNGTDGNIGSSLDNLGTQLVDIVVKNNDKANELPMPFGLGDKIAVIFKNAIIIISFGIFLIIAGAYIILAKVMTAILAVLGPIFICLALFPATRQYFMSWVNQVVNYSLYLVVVNVTASIFIGYLNSDFGLAGIEAETETGLVEVFLTSLIFFVVLLKLPELASGLAGGIANTGFGGAIQTASNMAKGGSAVGSASGKARQAGVRGYEALKRRFGKGGGGKMEEG
ncbi:type IV secretion system protein (plasmid) [Moraxella bovis]|uniref:type IV secretion system protein n=1 Tax=Moraxella bovis TaxID=476 RepID=UPI00222690C8|nr:type IV secretion system protein [Moraxella bovis]UZA49985.1 type IV secretion system protein [Moraxella bovis]